MAHIAHLSQLAHTSRPRAKTDEGRGGHRCTGRGGRTCAEGAFQSVEFPGLPDNGCLCLTGHTNTPAIPGTQRV